MKSLNKVVLAASFALSASIAQAEPRDHTCLLLAKQAIIHAAARGEGIPEAVLVEIVKETYSAPDAIRWQADLVDIARYVYTMKLSKEDARQLTYLRCMAGLYPSAEGPKKYDWQGR